MPLRKSIRFTILALLLVFVAAGAVTALWGYYHYRQLTPEGAYFQSGSVRIHYVDEGKGTPVILVHGLGADIGLNWIRPGILPALAKHYRVIALDLRGHGRSDKPHDPAQYGIALVDDIIALMDHLQIPKAHLIGYSMGGFIVTKLAVTHPERLWSVAPCGSGWTTSPEKDLDFLYKLADDLDKGKGFEVLLERLQPVGKPVGKAKIDAVSAVLTFHNDCQAIAAMLRSLQPLQVDEAALRQNKLPMLALIGERDPLKNLSDQMAAVTAQLQQVVVPEGDHFSTLGKPEALEALEAFLKSHTASALLFKAPLPSSLSKKAVIPGFYIPGVCEG